MPSKDELKLLQALPLENKIPKSMARIREAVDRYGIDGLYQSHSGGKDSCVLEHLIARVVGENRIEKVFSNTGLEYPEIQTFMREKGATIIRPKKQFAEVISEYGYPFISKEVAERVENARKCIGGGTRPISNIIINSQDKYPTRTKQILGIGGFFSERYDFSNWKDLLTLDFKISPYCCHIFKKRVLYDFEKKTGKIPFLGTMAEESQLRTTAWLKTGCNAFEGKKQKSTPIAFWTNQDILQYIKIYNIKIPTVYGDIVYTDGVNMYEDCFFNDCQLCTTGCSRTGCIFCGFGAHRERFDKGGDGLTRFERLKITHRKQYDYCMGGGAYDTDGFWKPTKDGLGMAHCIDELNHLYGKDFIRY